MPVQTRNQNKCKFFENYHICHDCGYKCEDSQKYLDCGICEKRFHIKCKKITIREYNSIKKNKHMYLCSDKCGIAPLPFTLVDNIDYLSALRGEGLFPCTICKRDCLIECMKKDCLDGTHCLECVVCDGYFHVACRYLDKDAYAVIVDNNYQAICSDKCYMSLMPFSNFKYGTLLRQSIFCEKKASSVIKEPTNHPTSSSLSKDYKSNFIKFDRFLDINCSFLNPSNLDDSIFSNDDHNLSIFHNNINTMNNFENIADIFNHCQNLPDILALTETRLKKDKPVPVLNGYHFENVDSPTAAGGVGVFLSDKLKYSVRNDLSLNVANCADIWINLELQDHSNLVLGVVYRHPGHNYSLFTEKICEKLNDLNLSKTKYVIVGDININLLKYNLVVDVTHYVNALNSIGCNLCIDKPTRISQSNNATLIDHVYSNFDCNILDTLILTSDVSDHFSTLTKIKGISKDNEDTDIFYRKQNLSDEEWELFNAELQNILHSEIQLSTETIHYDVNLHADKITAAYKKVIDKFMPLTKKKVSKKRKRNPVHKPWITPGMIESSDKKKTTI